MAIQFTTGETSLIDDQKKETESLPVYYSASNKALLPIGRDFEGYLILQGIDQKQKILAWLKDADKIELDNVDRDALVDTYINLRSEDADARIAELDETTNKFVDFKNSVFASGEDPSRFASIVELDLLLQSLQKPISELIHQRNLALHEKNMSALIFNRLKLEKSDTDTQRELRSWQSVVTAYPGQKG